MRIRVRNALFANIGSLVIFPVVLLFSAFLSDDPSSDLFSGFWGFLFGLYLNYIFLLWLVSLIGGLCFYFSKRKTIASKILIIPALFSIIGIFSLAIQVIT